MTEYPPTDDQKPEEPEQPAADAGMPPAEEESRVVSLMDLMSEEPQEPAAEPDDPTQTIPPPLIKPMEEGDTATIPPLPATVKPNQPPPPLLSEDLPPVQPPAERDEEATVVQPKVAFPAHTKVDLGQKPPPPARGTPLPRPSRPVPRPRPGASRGSPPPRTTPQPSRRSLIPPSSNPRPPAKIIVPAQSGKPRQAFKPRRGWLGCIVRGLFITALLGVIGVALGVVILSAGYISIARQLPAPSELRARSSSFETAIIYDNAGNQLWSLADPDAGNRTFVTIDEIAPDLINATIAVEDARFYTNPGFDPIGIARAILQAYQEGEVVSGASTITQQLARALLLDEEERTEISFSRKIKEIVLAAELTRTYPGRDGKNQLLELYLNEINYGNRAYGIEAAAQTYFNKDALSLTLAEASLLAGLPQAPAAWDPITRPDLAFNRQLQVLQQMEAEGYINHDQLLAALDETNRFIYDLTLPAISIEHPHFTLLALQELEDTFGAKAVYQGGLRIYTTLNPAVQAQAEATLASHRVAIANAGANNGAIVALNPATGEILALVGSLDFEDEAISGQINMAAQPRQPGSTIKPLVFLSAMQRGWTPATLIWDVETEFPDGANPTPYVPKNYDDEFHGPMRLRPALGNSYNIPAIKALEFVGVCDFIADAQQLGLSLADAGCADVGLPRETGLSLAVGGKAVSPLEMTSAFALMANGGRLQPATAIERIENRRGETLYSRTTAQPQASQAARSENSYLITHILSDNDARQPEFGLNNLLVIPGHQVSAKTGTSGTTGRDVRDVWTIGYTPEIAVAVWVGNTDNEVLAERASGYGVASPIWHDFMSAYLADKPPQSFPQPAGIAAIEVCADSGTVPGPSCVNRLTEFFAADQPPLGAEQDFVKRIPVNLWTGLAANENCPDNNFEAGFASPLVSGAEDALARERTLAVQWLSETRQGWDWAAARNIALPLRPPPAGQCAPDSPKPIALISSPIAGTQLPASATVNIVGSARAPGFSGYQLEYGLGQSPSSWTPIVEWRNSQVDNGLLGTWNAAGLPAGEVTLRLILFGPDNWFTPDTDLIRIETRQTFTLLAPTATVTPLPTNTPMPTDTPPPTATQPPTETPAPTDIPLPDEPTPTSDVIIITVPPPDP